MLKVEVDRRHNAMKHFPVFLLVIFAGLLIMALMLFLALHLDTIVRVTGSLLFGENSRGSGLFYAVAMAIPLSSGALMCLVIMLFSRAEEKRDEREREKAWRDSAGNLMKMIACVDSINLSIAKLRELSARLREQARRVSSFSGEMTGGGEMTEEEPERYGEKNPAPETFSVTLEDSEVSGLRLIHPTGSGKKDLNAPDPFRQERFPPPESHQKIWYFPNI